MTFGWEDWLTFVLVVGWTLWKYACLQRADRKRGSSAPSIPPMVAREEEPEVSEVEGDDEASEVFEEEWQETTKTKEEGQKLPPPISREWSETVPLPSEPSFPKKEVSVLREDLVASEIPCDGAPFAKDLAIGNVSTEVLKPEISKAESLLEKPKRTSSRLKNWMVGYFLLETPAFRRYR